MLLVLVHGTAQAGRDLKRSSGPALRGRGRWFEADEVGMCHGPGEVVPAIDSPVKNSF